MKLIRRKVKRVRKTGELCYGELQSSLMRRDVEGRIWVKSRSRRLPNQNDDSRPWLPMIKIRLQQLKQNVHTSPWLPVIKTLRHHIEQRSNYLTISPANRKQTLLKMAQKQIHWVKWMTLEVATVTNSAFTRTNQLNTRIQQGKSTPTRRSFEVDASTSNDGTSVPLWS